MLIFEEKPSKALSIFLELYSSIYSDIDIEQAELYIKNGINYYKGNIDNLILDDSIIQKKLENIWYNSLNNRFPDYSVYK